MGDAYSHDDARERPRGRGLGDFCRGHAWLIGALAASMVLLALSGTATGLILRYERDAVRNGEVWRLLTGHLVHADFRHLLLNLAGMGLVALLFGRDYSPRQWLLVMLASCAAIDIGFVFYEPQLAWYVGFSGVLHGTMAAGLVAWWRYENRAFTVTVGVLLMLKLLWEQLRGALPFSGDMPVIVNAHLYGAIGGLAGAALSRWTQRYWPRRARSL